MADDCVTCNAARHGSDQEVLDWQRRCYVCGPSEVTHCPLYVRLSVLANRFASVVHLGRRRSCRTIKNGWCVGYIDLALNDRHDVISGRSYSFECFIETLEEQVFTIPQCAVELSAYPSAIEHGAIVCVCWKKICGGSGALTKSAVAQQ